MILSTRRNDIGFPDAGGSDVSERIPPWLVYGATRQIGRYTLRGETLVECKFRPWFRGAMHTWTREIRRVGEDHADECQREDKSFMKPSRCDHRGSALHGCADKLRHAWDHPYPKNLNFLREREKERERERGKKVNFIPVFRRILVGIAAKWNRHLSFCSFSV